MNKKNKLAFILIIVHLFFGAQFIYAQDLDSLFAVGDYSRILKQFEMSPPSNFKDKILRAKTLQAKKFDKDALESYHLALLNQDDQPRHQFAYARLLKANDKLAPADSLFTLLHTRYPNNPEFTYQLGLCKAEFKNGSPEIYFIKAIENDSTHQQAAYELAKFYFKIKSFKKAEDTSLSALSYNPSNTKIIGLLGQIYYQQRKLNLALEQFEKLQQLTSLPKFVIEKMAIAYANTNKIDKSIEMYKRLLNLDPKSYRYHHQIAKAFALIENNSLAEKHAEKAIQLKDTSLDQERFTKALTLKKQNKLEDSLKLLELVIEETPDFERAFVELAMIADRLYKDLDKKLLYYENYERQFENAENSTFKTLMFRRLTDLRREKHFDSGK